MSLTTRVGLLAGASALTLTGASFGSQTATETSTETLRAEIAALRAEVAKLSADDNWLTEQRSEEIRGLVQDVLADADTRASLLQGGMTAGYDDGFVLGSTDGNFSLKMNGQLQSRFVFNNQDESVGGDSTRWGFENTRTKLWFSGNVVNPDWTYFIEGNFGRDGGSFVLEDAYISYAYGTGWTATIGQFKAPFLREELVHSMYQQAVERSLINEWFTAGRTQGVMMDYFGEQFHFAGAFLQDGANTANTAWSTYDTEWASGLRVEALLSGNWDQFQDFASWPDEEMGFMIGGAFHYQLQEYGTVTPNELEIYRFTVDASVEFGNANVFAAVIYATAENDATGAAAVDLEQMAFLIQGGCFLNADWELFGRWEWADPDMTGVDDVNIFTAGVTRYWAGHGLKWTSDIGYGIDGVPVSADIAGWRQDGLGQDGQIVFRTQMQLAF